MPKARRSPPKTHPDSPRPLAQAATQTVPAGLSAQTQDADATWQAAHDALQAALEAGNHLLDLLHEPDDRALVNAILDTLSQELDALNQEDMESRTLSLQAASQKLGGGLAHLGALKQQLAQIAASITAAAKVVDAIDGALSGISAFLATFPAV